MHTITRTLTRLSPALRSLVLEVLMPALGTAALMGALLTGVFALAAHTSDLPFSLPLPFMGVALGLTLLVALGSFAGDWVTRR